MRECEPLYAGKRRVLTFQRLEGVKSSEGAVLPLDDVQGEHCVCYLLKTYRHTAQITIQKGELFDD